MLERGKTSQLNGKPSLNQLLYEWTDPSINVSKLWGVVNTIYQSSQEPGSMNGSNFLKSTACVYRNLAIIVIMSLMRATVKAEGFSFT